MKIETTSDISSLFVTLAVLKQAIGTVITHSIASNKANIIDDFNKVITKYIAKLNEEELQSFAKLLNQNTKAQINEYLANVEKHQGKKAANKQLKALVGFINKN